MQQQAAKKKAIIIAGPTAAGKTAVAIAVAQYFQTEIISADSRQCYKELQIGVARPSAEELAAVPHHFIASHSITDEITAAGFESYALEKANSLFEKNNIVVMAGGTGLYIRAFCEGLDAVPEVPAEIRGAIIRQYETNGLAWLQQEVSKTDPLYYASGEIQNPQRLMRALEVKEATGQSILDFRKGKKAERPFTCIKIGLEWPRPVLYERIHARVDMMMQQGLEAEAKSLLPFKQYNALQTVGYEELFAFFEGKISREQAIEEIKKHTRHYAKRQLTWFKKDKEFTWFCPADLEKIKEHLKDALSQ